MFSYTHDTNATKLARAMTINIVITAQYVTNAINPLEVENTCT